MGGIGGVGEGGSKITRDPSGTQADNMQTPSGLKAATAFKHEIYKFYNWGATFLWVYHGH